MIVEMRTYTLNPRSMPTYLKIYAEKGQAVQRRVLGHMVGYYSVEFGDLNQVIHMWAYDSLADREARRAALQADPEWQTYLAASAGLVIKQENQVLKPAPFFTVPPPA